MKETYRFQYEQWHQDTKESRAADVNGSIAFIDAHGIWPKNKDANIFDVGCGMGRLLLAYQGRGYINLGGVEIDDYQLKIAKKEGLNVGSTDATDFFARNKTQYGLVTMIDCLEHIEKSKQISLLKNIYKSLNSDGQLVIRVPNALSPTFAYHRYIDFTHELSYTSESLGYVLKNAGFDNIIFRPAWQENEDIVRLKTPYAKLLKAEFGMKDPILTSNIVAVAFKSKKAFNDYIKQAPKIEINYENKKTWWNNIINR